MTELAPACPTCGEPAVAGYRDDEHRVLAYACARLHAWGEAGAALRALRCELIHRQLVNRAYIAAAEVN
jgi:hypothetical protein